MICKKCGASNTKGAVFCASCGARLDGKIECPKCKSLIPADTKFCPSCGEKIDVEAKKKVEKVEEVKVEKPIKPVESEVCTCGSPLSGFAKVERILSPTLILVGIVLLFVFSLINGVTTSATGTTLPSEYIISYSTFDFFGKVYTEYYKAVSTTPVSAFVLLQLVIGTLVVVGNMVVALVMLIVAAVKYGKGLKKGERPNLIKCFIPSYVLSIATSLIFLSIASYTTTYTTSTSQSISFGLNDASITAIIVPAGLIIAAYVLRTIKEKKNYPKGALATDILSVCKFVFLAISMFTIAKTFISITNNGYKLDMSFGNLIYQNATGASEAKVLSLCSESFFAFLMFVVCIVFIALTIATTIKSIAFEKKKTIIAFSIINAVFMTVVMFLAIAARTTLVSAGMDSKDISISSPILAMVFAYLAMGVDIALLVVKGNKIKKLNSENI